jgi:F0F1-type ATP synthase assembly protein I
MSNHLNQKNQKRNPKTKKTKKDKDQSPLKEYAKYSSLGFQMLVIILLGVFGGMKLDESVGSIDFPLFTLVFTVLAVFLAIYFAIKDFIRFK